jgi:hypothetical protein
MTRRRPVAAARTILRPGKKAKAAVNTVGIIEPPRKPCRARKTIMLSMSQAQPQSRLLAVNPAAETQNSQCVDMTRDSQPESGMTMISAMR